MIATPIETNNYTDSINRILNHTPFELTTQQKQALIKLWEFVNNPYEQFFLIKGYAGTGKSTVIFALIKELLNQGKRVALTAPTNKAVYILNQIAAKNELDIPTMTIHQLLGLTLVKGKGEQKLEITKPNCLNLFDCVILDECSMVNSELWEWIEKSFNNPLAEFSRDEFWREGINSHHISQRKLIAMGDPAQLNPVGEKRSPSFLIKNRLQLTQVVRQNQSPLLNFITDWRIALKEKQYITPHSAFNQNDKSNGAFKVSRENLIKYAIHQFCEHFENDPDEFRILCYTNKQVDWYNQIIRSHLYNNPNPYTTGERIISKQPIVAPDGNTIILPTSTEVIICDVDTDSHHGYQCWKLTVESPYNGKIQFFVLQEKEIKRYNQQLDNYLQKAKQHPYLWRTYYRFKDEYFAHITYCYALTIHNSQGSTFNQGAIDGKDLHKRLYVGDESELFKLKEYLRLWYVASSRFRSRLLFTV